MADLSILQLTNVLRTNQAKWLAKENNILTLSDVKRKQLLGATPPPGYTPAAAIAGDAGGAGEVAGFAPSVDWRNKNGNHITPVKH